MKRTNWLPNGSLAMAAYESADSSTIDDDVVVDDADADADADVVNFDVNDWTRHDVAYRNRCLLVVGPMPSCCYWRQSVCVAVVAKWSCLLNCWCQWH